MWEESIKSYGISNMEFTLGYVPTGVVLIIKSKPVILVLRLL